MVSDQFRIPLPFGSIDIDKNPDGSLNFGTNSDINILGYGLNSGLNFTSRNGSFSTSCRSLKHVIDFGLITSAGLGATIVQNQTYGLNSSFDVDQQKGLEINSDVNLGNKSIHVSTVSTTDIKALLFRVVWGKKPSSFMKRQTLADSNNNPLVRPNKVQINATSSLSVLYASRVRISCTHF